MAVLAVVGFHLAPDFVKGGFAGVDVFFVISGFLVTDLILRRGTDRFDLRDFVARRARRLLPAASLVIVATLTAGMLLLPRTRWWELGAHAAASALQYENWLLAGTRADYLHPADPLSPFQHFWSLSIEWQSYLILAIAVIATSVRGIARPALLAALVAAATAGTLAIALAGTDAGSAHYFSLLTRFWEFGAGALLALWPRARSRIAGGEVIAVLGLVMIVAGAVTSAESAVIPGATTLLAVAGTVLVLAGAQPGTRTGTVLAAMPLRVIGDHSYALYLWHWPLIVLFLQVSGSDEVGPLAALALVAVTAVLAALSTRFVERPLHLHPLSPRLGRALAVVAVVPALAAGLVLGGVGIARAQLDQALDPTRPGAAAIDPNVAAILATVPFSPDLSVARGDYGDAGDGDHCLSAVVTPIVCVFGDPDAEVVVAVTGDSHAWQWVPALDEIGQQRGWRILTVVRPSCPIADTPVEVPGIGDTGECALWRELAVELLQDLRPAVVITGGLTPDGYEVADYHVADVRQFALGYRAFWDRLAVHGIVAVAIRDVPHLPTDVPDCVALDPSTPERCDANRALALDSRRDPLVDAANATDVRVIDLSDWICRTDVCPVVVGNVLVYRDRHHMTATYVRTLAPMLLAELQLSGALTRAEEGAGSARG